MGTYEELLVNVQGYCIALISSKPVCYVVAFLTCVASSYWKAGPELWRILLQLAPVVFMMDFTTGVVKSKVLDKKPFSSDGMGRSMVKAYVYITLVVLGFVLDCVARTGYTAQIAILVFMVAREGTSVLENLRAMQKVSGIEVPKDMIDKFNDFGKGDKK